jgi:hypothetical protein
VAQPAGLDPAGLQRGVDLVSLKAEHATQLVGGDLALVDESVQGPRRDTETPGGGRRAHHTGSSVLDTTERYETR